MQSDFKAASFVAGLELVQNMAEQALQLISFYVFFDAAGLATIIGFLCKDREAVKDSLIDLYKWLKGKKPDKAVQVGNDVEITFGQQRKTVNDVIFKLYSDAGIRAGLGRLTSPLRQAAIDRISVKQDRKEQTAIEKSEAEYFA